MLFLRVCNPSEYVYTLSLKVYIYSLGLQTLKNSILILILPSEVQEIRSLKSTLSQPAHPITYLYIYMNLRLQLNSWPLQLSCLERRLRTVPLFRGFRFPGMRKERTDFRQHIKKWNRRCPHNEKIPIGRNRYACQSNLIRSNYAINNFQTEYWFYTGCVKIKVIELQRAFVSELLRMNEIFSSSERSGF
jgi:hypothetical protein